MSLWARRAQPVTLLWRGEQGDASDRYGTPLEAYVDGPTVQALVGPPTQAEIGDAQTATAELVALLDTDEPLSNIDRLRIAGDDYELTGNPVRAQLSRRRYLQVGLRKVG